MQLSLSGRNALVTGASSGLGPFIVKALDASGANVVLQYHGNQAGAEAIAADCSNNTAVLQADMGDTDSVDKLFTDAVAAVPEQS